MAIKTRTKQELMAEVNELRARLAEADQVLQAIRDYEVDALVVQAPQGDRVFALETADHVYRQMVEQMRDGAATLTTDGLVLFANQPLAELLRCPIDQIVGAPFEKCVPPADQPRLAALLQDPAGGRTAGHVQTQDGTRRPVSFSVSRVLIDEEPLVMLLVTDLTNARRAERTTKHLQLTTRLAASLTPAQVGEAIVISALHIFDAQRGHVAVPAGEAAATWRSLWVSSYPSEHAQQLAGWTIPLSRPAAEAGRLRVPVLAEAEDFDTGDAPEDTHAILAVPLLLRERLVGLLQVEFTGEWVLEPEDRDFVLTVAQQCAQAIERAGLYTDLDERIQARTIELRSVNDQLATANRRLQDEIAERRSVQRQLERSREEERMRIARELHDELGGDLTALKIDVARLLRAEQLPEDQRERLTGISRSIDSAIRSVRRLATELRPQLLDDFGLGPALEAHFQDFLKWSGLSGEIACTIDDHLLNAEAGTACFRIFQEALTNVARHAQATHVNVRLEPDGQGVLLRISDDGVGMDPAAHPAPGHLGLIGIRERASVLAAHVEIISQPGQGTTILLRMPASPPDNAAA